MIALLILIATPLIGYGQYSDYTFFEGTYEQLQTRAMNAQKPYFVLFYANWSQQSKKMFDETFNDQGFIQYAEANYLGIALDGESVISSGKELAETYHIMYFPAVLIFTPEGKLVRRINGFQNARQLTTELRKHEKMRGNPELRLEEEAAKEPVSVQGEYLFKVTAKMLPRVGYGVQLAAFSNYRSTFEKLLELENQRFHHNVMTFIKEKSETGELLYKLILGPFSTKEQADQYQKLLQKKDKSYYKNTLVVDLTDM